MRTILAASTVAALLFPSLALAFPFGGRASQVSPCYNNAIISYVGAPRGGVYIWTPSTRTYQFGPPSHAGQWLLGLAGAPYYCIITVVPIDVRAGINITMLGTSQQ
jgi:hypothetical protein